MNVKKRYIAAVSGALMLGGVAYDHATGPDTLSRIIDGDTIIINGSTHIRLWGIDAPELDQHCTRDNGSLKVQWACGKVAKGYLESFFKANVKLKCEEKSKDRYQRSVAICYAINVRGEKHDIAKSIVSAGYAFDWAYYSNGFYALDEEYARSRKLGVWSGTAEKPWDYRNALKQTQ